MLTVLMKKNNRLTVSETARLMEASEQFVRQGLINGIFPWGYAVKMSSRWTYWISPVKFTEVTGIQV